MVTQDTSTLQQVSEGLAAAVERAAASTVLVSARRRIPASGVVWPGEGLVVTADHVIESEDGIAVGLPDDSEVSAQLVGRDPGSDLAVLRIDGGSSEPAELASEGTTKVGHLVLAVGRPAKGGPQASLGVVGAVGGPWRSRRGTQVEGYIRSDATFYPGFSGGPLVDAEGRVAGINTSGFRGGQGLTIPAAAVTKVVELLRTQGRIRRAYLGIGSQAIPLPDVLAKAAGGERQSALLVTSVEGGSPADRGGMLVGDILIGVEGVPVQDTEDLQSGLGPERVGVPVQVNVLRGGTPRDQGGNVSGGRG